MYAGDELYDDDVTSGLTPHDRLALRLFGVTRQWAHNQGVCIRCRERVGVAGLFDKEYRISALCGPCFVAMTPEDK